MNVLDQILAHKKSEFAPDILSKATFASFRWV